MNLSMPRHLEVRCCCDPNKRLGWVRIEGPIEPGRKLRFCTQRAAYQLTKPMAFSLHTPADPNRWPADARFIPARYIEAEIEWLHFNETDGVLAVKNHDYPIEEWRNVVGFVEDKHLLPDAPVRG